MDMKHQLFIGIVGLALSGAALAQPTESFYLMRNKLSGKAVCAQHPISPEWGREAGPFKDQDCKIADKPEPRRSDLPASPLELVPKKKE